MESNLESVVTRWVQVLLKRLALEQAQGVQPPVSGALPRVLQAWVELAEALAGRQTSAQVREHAAGVALAALLAGEAYEAAPLPRGVVITAPAMPYAYGALACAWCAADVPLDDATPGEVLSCSSCHNPCELWHDETPSGLHRLWLVRSVPGLGALPMARRDGVRAMLQERLRQDATHGFNPSRPDGTGSPARREEEQAARARHEAARARGEETWADALDEEAREVLAANSPEELRKKLVQLGALCLKWLEALDVRTGVPFALGVRLSEPAAYEVARAHLVLDTAGVSRFVTAPAREDVEGATLDARLRRFAALQERDRGVLLDVEAYLEGRGVAVGEHGDGSVLAALKALVEREGL